MLILLNSILCCNLNWIDALFGVEKKQAKLILKVWWQIINKEIIEHVVPSHTVRMFSYNKYVRSSPGTVKVSCQAFTPPTWAAPLSDKSEIRKQNCSKQLQKQHHSN